MRAEGIQGEATFFDVNARASHRPHGFTLIEVGVVLAVIALLLLVGIPMIRNSGRPARRIQCINNLKNVGLAFRIFALDNTNRFPFELSSTRGGTLELCGDPQAAWRQFAILSNALSVPILVQCPSDQERRQAMDWRQFTNNQHLSYFAGLGALADYPDSILSGDRNLTLDGRSLREESVTFSTNATAGFDQRIHRFAGNIALGDGSVQQATSGQLSEMFHAAAQTGTNTVMIP